MKKLILFISLLFSVSAYSQTVYINNSTGCDFYIHTIDFVEIDCSTGTKIPSTISYPIFPGTSFSFGISNSPYSATIYAFAGGATQTIQTQVGCGAGGNPSGTLTLSGPSPCNVTYTVTWTDLSGGDVQIDIF